MIINRFCIKKNVHQSLPIASLTKLLTVLTVEQNTNDTDLVNKQILVHDNNLVKFSLNPNYSNIPLALNQSYSLQNFNSNGYVYILSDAAALALANSDYDLFNREMLKTAKRSKLTWTNTIFTMLSVCKMVTWTFSKIKVLVIRLIIL